MWGVSNIFFLLSPIFKLFKILQIKRHYFQLVRCWNTPLFIYTYFIFFYHLTAIQHDSYYRVNILLTILFSINSLPRHSHQADLNLYARRLFISFLFILFEPAWPIVCYPYARACPPPITILHFQERPLFWLLLLSFEEK